MNFKGSASPPQQAVERQVYRCLLAAMSRSEWRTNAAIVGGVTAVFLVAAGVTSAVVQNYRHHHERERADAAYPQQGATAQNAKLYCSSHPQKDQVRCTKEYVENEKSNARARYDLQAQQEMAEWALGMFLLSGFGLLFSAFGLVALVWTFREQRKLTIGQQRAFLQVEGGALWPIMHHSTECLHVEVAIRNSGLSHAKNIIVSGSIVYLADIGENGVPLGDDSEMSFHGGQDNLPPGEIDVIHSLLPLHFPINAMIDRRFGSGGPNIGTEEMRAASITFSGVIRYTDDLGTKEALPFGFTAYTLESGSPTMLEGGHKNWRAQTYIDRNIEREERARQRAIAEFERRKK